MSNFIPPSEPPSFSLEESIPGGVVVITVRGYFNDSAGQELSEIINRHLREDRTRFVFDFQFCSLINSMGVADLLEIALRIVEDFKGKLILSALKPFMAEILTLASVLPIAKAAQDAETALKDISSD